MKYQHLFAVITMCAPLVSGRIVGTWFDANGSPRVFLWDNDRMYDLNALVQPNAPL